MQDRVHKANLNCRPKIIVAPNTKSQVFKSVIQLNSGYYLLKMSLISKAFLLM